MKYLKALWQFRGDYRLGFVAVLKLALLYPAFRMRQFYYYGSPAKKKLAEAFFRLFPADFYISIRCLSSLRNKYVSVPVWIVPDHLSSFLEIFWDHSYRLKQAWAPVAVIDAGANLGYATLYFAMHNPVERILAIEANENLAKKLGVTAASARTMGVDVRVALGAVLGRSRKVSFSVRENSRDSSLSELIEGKEVSVEGLRLSEWIERSGFKDGDFRRRNLLKIDVEGAEYEILAEDPQAFSYANYLVGEIHGPSSERDKFVGQLGTSFSPGERIVNSACHTVEVLYAEKLPAEAAVNAEGRAPNSPGNAAHRH